MVRLLVTGSRSWTDPRLISEALHRATGGDVSTVTLVHGACPDGADAMVDALARRLHMDIDAYPARWTDPCVPGCKPGHRRRGKRGEFCPTAGHRRNQAMVDSGPDLCLAFMRDNSAGTHDCVLRAVRAGVPVTLHSLTTTTL